MEREIIRVEPFSTNFEKWGAPVSVCTRAGNMVFMSGMPPFDPDTGELLQHAPFERQAERILEQMKTALEAAGSDLDHVLKCNVLCISAERFKTFNEIYKRYFPKNPPARESSSASRSGPVRSISRSTAWPSRRAEITGKDSAVARAMRMSACGTKRTSRDVRLKSAFRRQSGLYVLGVSFRLFTDSVL